MTDINAAFVQQILYIQERKRAPNIEHHGQAYDLGVCLEVAEGTAFYHLQTLRNRAPRLKPVSSDSAHPHLWPCRCMYRAIHCLLGYCTAMPEWGPGSVPRRVQELLSNDCHKPQVLGALVLRLLVQVGPRQRQ